MLTPARGLSILLVAVAAVVLATGSGCTKKGKDFNIIPTPTPSPTPYIYVNPKTGSDTSGNGTQAEPYKTLTKAVTAVKTTGMTIFLAEGTYSTASGETFPIIVPTGVTLTGANYSAAGYKVGSFIDGSGEDKAYEQAAGLPAGSAFAALEIGANASVSASALYVGVSKLSLPAGARYVSTDVLGILTATQSVFGAGVVSSLRSVNGVLAAGGQFTCTSCAIKGNNYAVGAVTLPSASTTPSVTLSSSGYGQSTIQGKVVGILTDGSAALVVSGQIFQLGSYAYEDTMKPVGGTAVTPGTVDFGSPASSGGSSGGNSLRGASVSEISVTLPGELVTAINDSWNDTQGTNGSGQYAKSRTFVAPVSGQNVTIAASATGSSVTVGPYIVPPTPSPSPTGSATASPSPTASAT